MTVHGCCAAIHVLVVVFRLVPLKLYGVVGSSPTQVSAALVIVIVPALHSYHVALANVNVGGTPS